MCVYRVLATVPITALKRGSCVGEEWESDGVTVWGCCHRCLVVQLCLTLCDSMDCNPPGSSVHGILQVRILEWIAISVSRGSSHSGIEPMSPALAGGVQQKQTLIYRMDKQKVLLQSTRHYIQHPVINHNGKEYFLKCVCISESLCCTAKINTRLWIN